MKKYLIKTIFRDIYGKVYHSYVSKEYQSLAIAKRYLRPLQEQIIIERTIWFDKNYRKHYKDVELPRE